MRVILRTVGFEQATTHLPALRHNHRPSRFVCVSGEAPKGWKVEHGAVVKDPDAWNGPELTDAARARYSDFLIKFSLVFQATHPMTLDEVTGPSAPAPRSRLFRTSDGGQSR